MRQYAIMLFLIVFFLLPILEIITFLAVSKIFGFLMALLIWIIIAILGCAILKRQGLKNSIRARQSLKDGLLPPDDLFDNLLITLAGGLMVLPGFLTDLIGLLLLIPQLRTLIKSKKSKNMHFQSTSFSVNSFTENNSTSNDPNVIDVPFKTIEEQDKP